MCPVPVLFTDIVTDRSEDRGHTGALIELVILKTACQPVVMKNAWVFWHLPLPLATPFLIFKSGLAPFLPDEAEWR